MSTRIIHNLNYRITEQKIDRKRKVEILEMDQFEFMGRNKLYYITECKNY